MPQTLRMTYLPAFFVQKLCPQGSLSVQVLGFSCLRFQGPLSIRILLGTARLIEGELLKGEVEGQVRRIHNKA